jgi:alginate O-acetyltransferase complex protein AlgI
LFDYIYVPLGGSRASAPRVYTNVLVTMLVSGIWHGAGMHFIVWGLWHGILLAMHRAWRHLKSVARVGQATSRMSSGGAWLATLVLVNAGWAFFCMDLKTALLFFRRLVMG